MRLLTTTEKRRYANELKSGKTTYKKIAQELSMDEVDVEKQIKRYIRDLEQEQEKQEIQAKNIKVQEEKKLQELTTQKTYIDEVKEKVEDIFESNLELNETKNQLNEIQIVDKETLNSIIDDYKETQEDEYKKTRIGIVQKQLQKENPDE
ncbi:MAG: hypothetical protein LBL91_04620, partial [Lachnospiraceae bacterium]|nr:hypothetical protein [Lachnospiraceae bacterium]